MENGKDISSPYISDAGKGGSPQLITEEPMEEPVYKVVEVMPEFPGGMKALMDFIQKNIRYPEEAQEWHSGKSYCQRGD